MKKQQGSGLLAGLIIVGLLLIPLFFMLQLGYLNRLTSNFKPAGGNEQKVENSNPTAVINQANEVKIQADLKSILVAIEAFYAEQGDMPDSLSEIASFSGPTATNTVYRKCSSSSAYFYYNSTNYPGYVLNNGISQPTSGQVPSCG